MKTDWEDAPTWAKFLTENSDGERFWWECEPKESHGSWYCFDGRRRGAGWNIPKPIIERRP